MKSNPSSLTTAHNLAVVFDRPWAAQAFAALNFEELQRRFPSELRVEGGQLMVNLGTITAHIFHRGVTLAHPEVSLQVWRSGYTITPHVSQVSAMAWQEMLLAQDGLAEFETGNLRQNLKKQVNNRQILKQMMTLVQGLAPEKEPNDLHAFLMMETADEIRQRLLELLDLQDAAVQQIPNLNTHWSAHV